MKFFEKVKSPNGRRRIYFCGIKIFTYGKRKNNSDHDIYTRLRYIEQGLADPNGIGRLFLLLRNASVAPRYYYIFQKMKDTDVCIDCGAHMGVFTDICIHQFAHVHAFEPSVDAFSILQNKYRNNSLVTLHNKAVSDKDGEMPFYCNESENEDFWGLSQGSSYIKKSDEYVAAYHVKVIDLCSYLEGILLTSKSIYILKLDIEGAECEILEKIISSKIYTKIKYIFCEVHDKKYPQFFEKTEALRQRIKEEEIENIYLDWF